MPFRRVPSSHPAAVDLSIEQQSVLACVEAGLGEDDTCASTGLDPARVEAVVRDLVDLQLLQPDDGGQAYDGDGASSAMSDDELPDGVEPWSGADMPRGSTSSHDLHASHAPSQAPKDPGSISSVPPRRSRPPALDEVNFRRIYETRFRELELGARQDVALHLSGSELFALCLDPAPQVIAALLDNSHFGLDHARLIALHHKTPQGLEILARRAQLVRDSHVQRRLLTNLQTPETVLERILRYKRLIDIYRLSIDRELPERNRVRVRARLKPHFMTAEPEDRAALIIKTEGRCLTGLIGCTFDGRTTQILCNYTIVSTLFIQNLARFPATPAALIAKLLRSPTVQRQPTLRSLLMRHPHAGSDVKRRG